MKLSDIIALAKQGYKVSDIKELMSLADQEPAEEKAPATTKAEDKKPATTETEEDKPAEQEPAGTEAEEEKPAEQEPDYKALYEAEKKKRQEENRRKEAGHPDTFDESKFLQDIASMY